jgi:hypothetical protein
MSTFQVSYDWINVGSNVIKIIPLAVFCSTLSFTPLGNIPVTDSTRPATPFIILPLAPSLPDRSLMKLPIFHTKEADFLIKLPIIGAV